MRGQILGRGGAGRSEPVAHVGVGLRGGQQRGRPVMTLTVQLRREHAGGHASLHGCSHAVEAGIGEGKCVVFGTAGCSDAVTIRNLEHHAQRHERWPAAGVANLLQSVRQLMQDIGLRQRSRAPVIAFDDQHRVLQYRFAPARNQRAGKCQQHPRPQHQQHDEHKRQHRHQYPIPAATSATVGSTRSILLRLRPSFHLSRRISEKAL